MVLFLTCVHCVQNASPNQLERRPSLEPWDADLREEVARLDPRARARMNAELAKFRASLAARNGESHATDRYSQNHQTTPSTPYQDASHGTSGRPPSSGSRERDIDAQLHTLQASSRAWSAAGSSGFRSGEGSSRASAHQTLLDRIQRFRPQGSLFSGWKRSKSQEKPASGAGGKARSPRTGSSTGRPPSPLTESVPLLGASNPRRRLNAGSLFRRKPRSSVTEESRKRLTHEGEAATSQSSTPGMEGAHLKGLNDAVSRFRDLDMLHSTRDVFGRRPGLVMLEQARRGWQHYYPDVQFEAAGQPHEDQTLMAKTMLFGARDAHDTYIRHLTALRQQAATLLRLGEINSPRQHELRQALQRSNVVRPAMENAIGHLEQAIQHGGAREMAEAISMWGADMARVTKKQ